MTILERKAELIRQILDTDEINFVRIEKYFKNISTEHLPGQESIEEMRAGVERATRDYYDGRKNYISHEEIKATFKL